MLIDPVQDLFSSAVAAYNTAESAEVEFTVKPVWDFNKVFNINDPTILLVTPLKRIEKDRGEITGREIYRLTIFALSKSKLSEHQDTRTVTVDRMDDLMKNILERVRASVLSIDNVVTDDVYNFCDVNTDGVGVAFDLVIRSVC